MYIKAYRGLGQAGPGINPPCPCPPGGQRGGAGLAVHQGDVWPYTTESLLRVAAKWNIPVSPPPGVTRYWASCPDSATKTGPLGVEATPTCVLPPSRPGDCGCSSNPCPDCIAKYGWQRACCSDGVCRACGLPCEDWTCSSDYDCNIHHSRCIGGRCVPISQEAKSSCSSHSGQMNFHGVWVEAPCGAPAAGGGWGTWCPPGYKCSGSGYGAKCVPIDPCAGVTCPPGTQCQNGQCVPVDPCANVRCPQGYQCQNGRCVPVDPCAHVYCPPRTRCQNGRCVPVPCTGPGAEPCPPGYVCDAATNTCVPDKCYNVQCPPGRQCDPQTGQCKCVRPAMRVPPACSFIPPFQRCVDPATGQVIPAQTDCDCALQCGALQQIKEETVGIVRRIEGLGAMSADEALKIVGIAALSVAAGFIACKFMARRRQK